MSDPDNIKLLFHLLFGFVRFGFIHVQLRQLLKQLLLNRVFLARLLLSTPCVCLLVQRAHEVILLAGLTFSLVKGVGPDLLDTLRSLVLVVAVVLPQVELVII